MLEVLLVVWVWATGVSVAVLLVVMAVQRLLTVLVGARALPEPYPGEQSAAAPALARSA